MTDLQRDNAELIARLNDDCEKAETLGYWQMSMPIADVRELANRLESLSPQPPAETGDDELIRRELGEAVDALLNAAEVVQLKSINAINRIEALSRKGRGK